MTQKIAIFNFLDGIMDGKKVNYDSWEEFQFIVNEFIRNHKVLQIIPNQSGRLDVNYVLTIVYEVSK